MFSCEISNLFKNTFFTEHLQLLHLKIKERLRHVPTLKIIFLKNRLFFAMVLLFYFSFI